MMGSTKLRLPVCPSWIQWILNCDHGRSRTQPQCILTTMVKLRWLVSTDRAIAKFSMGLSVKTGPSIIGDGPSYWSGHRQFLVLPSKGGPSPIFKLACSAKTRKPRLSSLKGGLSPIFKSALSALLRHFYVLPHKGRAIANFQIGLLRENAVATIVLPKGRTIADF